MGRRTALIALTAAAVSAPAGAAKEPPPTPTPQDAVAVVRNVLQRTSGECRTDWASISAVGFEGDWDVTVRIRSSDAGDGKARWHIGTGWPRAVNALAKALAQGCPAG